MLSDLLAGSDDWDAARLEYERRRRFRTRRVVDASVAVGEGDIDVQVEQVFTNMCAVVEEAGGSMDDIVSTTTYLTDVTQAPSISAARARHFTGDVLPTHTVIGVAALARPQFLVEISAIAHLG